MTPTVVNSRLRVDALERGGEVGELATRPGDVARQPLDLGGLGHVLDDAGQRLERGVVARQRQDDLHGLAVLARDQLATPGRRCPRRRRSASTASSTAARSASVRPPCALPDDQGGDVLRAGELGLELERLGRLGRVGQERRLVVLGDAAQLAGQRAGDRHHDEERDQQHDGGERARAASGCPAGAAAGRCPRRRGLSLSRPAGRCSPSRPAPLRRSRRVDPPTMISRPARAGELIGRDRCAIVPDGTDRVAHAQRRSGCRRLPPASCVHPTHRSDFRHRLTKVSREFSTKALHVSAHNRVAFPATWTVMRVTVFTRRPARAYPRAAQGDPHGHGTRTQPAAAFEDRGRLQRGGRPHPAHPVRHQQRPRGRRRRDSQRQAVPKGKIGTITFTQRDVPGRPGISTGTPSMGYLGGGEFPRRPERPWPKVPLPGGWKGALRVLRPGRHLAGRVRRLPAERRQPRRSGP